MNADPHFAADSTEANPTRQKEPDTGPTAADQKTKLKAELLEGLDRFYAGDYQAAIQRLTDYTTNRGEKQPLAHFYLGASKLGLYYLGGSQNASLQQDGLKDLVTAKRAGYKPDSSVSPKFLQTYRDLSY